MNKWKVPKTRQIQLCRSRNVTRYFSTQGLFIRSLVALCFFAFINTWANTPPEALALALQQSQQGMQDRLQHSPFNRPLLLSSQEAAEHLGGDLYASLAPGLDALAPVAASAERWCEILLLLSNAKACRALPDTAPARLQLSISSSKTADASGASLTEFTLDARAAEPGYMAATLRAADGPAGTQNIQLRLEAIPQPGGHSFIHLQYAYDTHLLGRMAMQAYLQTLGRGKTGFTLIDQGGVPTPIGGARGVIERNTMRYFLGLECALTHAAQPVSERFGQMAACWWGAVEQYPQPLHEMARDEYLAIN